MNEKLVDTVSNIVATYGVGILSNSKFWSILIDSYSFALEHSLKEEFKQCISKGCIATIISLTGNKKKTINYIQQLINTDKRQDKTDLAACLFSIAIAIGTCNKNDYVDFIKLKPNKAPQKPAPSKPQNTQSKRIYGYAIPPVLLGFISLFVGSALYLWFLLGDAVMFWVLLIIAFLQLGACKVFMETLESNWTQEAKVQAYSCYLPILVAFILNSFIPFFLCSDSIADSLYSYFSADYIPSFYYIETTQVSWLIHRKSPEVGFWGVAGAFALCFCLVTCALEIYSPQNSCGYPRFKIKIKNAIITSVVIFCGYIGLTSLPFWELKSKEEAYNTLMESNRRLYRERITKKQDLSFKNLRLGISMETAYGYLSNLDSERKPSKFGYNFTIKIPEELYDCYLNIKYNKVFPYKIPKSFEGVHLSGMEYRICTEFDNQKVRVDVYGDNGIVRAITIEGYSSDGHFVNFDSILQLYKSKYGEPEIIKDYSKEKDIYSDYHFKGPVDRYQWHFQNGTIQVSEYGILYISADYIKKVNQLISRATSEYRIRIKVAAEEQRLLKMSKEKEKRSQEYQDSIRRVKNHENAINEI